jgi:hypothetical protein
MVQKKLGRIGLIVVVAVLGVLVAGAAWLIRDERRLNVKYPVKASEATPSPQPTQWEWIHLSAKDLSDEYVVNSTAANQKYRGQHLAVTGAAEQIVVGREGARSSVSLFASGLEIIKCQLKSSDQSMAGNLHRGDRVEARGVCDGNDALNIILSDCTITRK